MHLHRRFQCPDCGCRHITRFHRPFRERVILAFIWGLPYRCKKCGHIFYLFDNNPLIKLIVLAAAMFILIIAALNVVFYDTGSGKARSDGQGKSQSAQLQNHTKGTGGSQATGLENQASPPPLVRFDGYRKFGAKWDMVENGLRISRIRRGPLKDAGLRQRDIIISVDGKDATDELMFGVRDRIVSGEQETAVIGVLRGKERLIFKLEK